MPFFKKVLYSTDFSPLAGYAFDYVKKLKSAGMEEVVVVHVVNELTVALPEGADLLKEKEIVEVLDKADREYLLNVIERASVIKNELEKAGISVILKIVAGSNAAEMIVRIAEEENVNMIVIGAHGKGFLKELILGSVSLDVVRKSKCPVLLIKKGD
ncbi:universal stress protein [Desulfurobacterium atlanticum]|uniref:Nucleotide-binding universal stress protein, UspA family n=1 Tax=Desulfurobacterium atlanticum TaxID=240169 RepID=A0A238YZM9_9BACT|nr:universal stress protein [Desulfurobacterium atlanticum]SNR76093.1 Nucleotide-binding universal stress protein, UspA family [Desulfurobacterium atlanticum]